MKDKPRTSPKVSYLPSPELVNNYSYTAATVPTRKISIATKVSNTLNLSEILVSKIFLWFELSFTYIVIALVFAVFSLTWILGTALLFTPKLVHEPNLWIAFIISIILSILYFYFIYKFQDKYKKSYTVSLLKIAYEDLFQTLLFTSSIVGYYILDHNRVNTNLFVQIGLCVVYLPLAYIECIRASPHTSQFRSFPYDWKKVDKIVCPTRILGLIISIFLGLGFVVKSKDMFNSGFELYISAFISSIVMMISYGMIVSIIHAIAIDTNVDRSKWFK
ncbi:hypothetical protein [Chamaesiphon sp. VAR_48_metabat_403]|uniref:hypothetical protein n=1 Tax=Chamaesiphon sp. VAR_48_metabat_403 TaxID=2964700 RepID=UPI00286E4AB7|nr:hypothetical protein [Chamaesiphon sp. VAR_48_metabat_403]